MQDSRHVANKTFRSAFRTILCLIGLGVMPLASAQSFWEYSAHGSVTDPQGNILNITGSLLIDGTVRAWHSPHLPSEFPQNQQHTFLVSRFDLDIGNLDFFGGPFSDPGKDNSLYIAMVDNPSGTGQDFSYFAEWFLAGSGDFTQGVGDSQFFNSDGTAASAEDIFQAPPAVIKSSGRFIDSTGPLYHAEMDFTRGGVAPIPEPEIYAMMGIGLGLMTWVARRKKLKESAPA